MKKGNTENEKKGFSAQVKEMTEAIGKGLNEQIAECDIPELLENEDENRKATEELDEAKKLAADYLDKLRRNMAEFDNFRKRTIKEKASIYDDSVRELLDKLLPVLDNFELAVNAVTNREDVFYKGVEMILRQLKNVFFDIGVEEISALGAQFDPQLHNAVMHVTDEAFGANEIIDEIRKGYVYKDKVIRHSMVKVAN